MAGAALLFYGEITSAGAAGWHLFCRGVMGRQTSSLTWASIMAVIAIVSALLTSTKPTQTPHWYASCVLTGTNYSMLLVWAICVLLFWCGVLALTQHSDWFNA